MALTAVLFDLDGVLVHSFDFWLAVMNDCAQDLGHPPVTSRALASSWGQSVERDAGEFFPDVTTAQLRSRYDVRMAAHADRIVPCPQNCDVAAHYRRQDLPIGIITNSSRAFTRVALGRLPFDPELVVSSEDVRRPKPAPDGLLMACRRLAVEPADVLFIGDSPSDVEAAARAGVQFTLVACQALACKAVAQ